MHVEADEGESISLTRLPYPGMVLPVIWGLAGLAAGDYARAQADGGESTVQGLLRWVTEDVLGVDGVAGREGAGAEDVQGVGAGGPSANAGPSGRRGAARAG